MAFLHHIKGLPKAMHQTLEGWMESAEGEGGGSVHKPQGPTPQTNTSVHRSSAPTIPSLQQLQQQQQQVPVGEGDTKETCTPRQPWPRKSVMSDDGVGDPGYAGSPLFSGGRAGAQQAFEPAAINCVGQQQKQQKQKWVHHTGEPTDREKAAHSRAGDVDVHGTALCPKSCHTSQRQQQQQQQERESVGVQESFVGRASHHSLSPRSPGKSGPSVADLSMVHYEWRDTHQDVPAAKVTAVATSAAHARHEGQHATRSSASDPFAKHSMSSCSSGSRRKDLDELLGDDSSFIERGEAFVRRGGVQEASMPGLVG
mmetsp:Transcript_10099/g.26218  ORF Transcript_10099/g.26218 Transcript_10099/m.26218 type:complete len:313 (+) Transcript_10099:1278-2216(+)